MQYANISLWCMRCVHVQIELAQNGAGVFKHLAGGSLAALYHRVDALRPETRDIIFRQLGIDIDVCIFAVGLVLLPIWS